MKPSISLWTGRNRFPLLFSGGFLASVALFWPGVGNNDSASQIIQGLTWTFNDQHPPALSLFWGAVMLATGTWKSLVVVTSGLYWLGLYFLSGALGEDRIKFGVFAIGLSPWLFGFSGALVKDLYMAVLLLMAMALVVKSKTSLPRFILVCTLLALAVLVRYNAVFAALPILVAAAIRGSNSKVVSLTKSGGGFLSITGIFIAFTALFPAQPTHHENSVLFDDLAAVSIANNESKISGVALEELQGCWGTARFGIENGSLARCTGHWNAGNKKLSGSLIGQWIDVIPLHLPDYLAYRSSIFFQFLSVAEAAPTSTYVELQNLTFQDQIQFQSPRQESVHLIEFWNGLGRSLVPQAYSPGILLIVNLLLFVYIFYSVRHHRQLSDLQRLSVTLLASSSLYILGYFPLAMSNEFRYSYWSIMATSLVGTICLLSLRRQCNGTSEDSKRT